MTRAAPLRPSGGDRVLEVAVVLNSSYRICRFRRGLSSHPRLLTAVRRVERALRRPRTRRPSTDRNEFHVLPRRASKASPQLRAAKRSPRHASGPLHLRFGRTDFTSTQLLGVPAEPPGGLDDGLVTISISGSRTVEVHTNPRRPGTVCQRRRVLLEWARLIPTSTDIGRLDRELPTVR